MPMPLVGTTVNESTPLSTSIRSTPSCSPPFRVRFSTRHIRPVSSGRLVSSNSHDGVHTDCSTSVSTKVTVSAIAQLLGWEVVCRIIEAKIYLAPPGMSNRAKVLLSNTDHVG